MLLREVEYVRPSSLDEAVRLLGANDGARALAGQAVHQAELGRLGALKLGDIEAAQRRLATIARELAEQGELFILGRRR